MVPTYRRCCDEYYRQQAQYGSGPLPRYNPQVGHGLFGSMFKNVIPFLKSKVLPTAINTVANVATDLVSGKSLKESVTGRGKQALKNIVKESPLKNLLTGFTGENKTSRSSARNLKRKQKFPRRRVGKKRRNNGGPFGI